MALSNYSYSIFFLCDPRCMAHTGLIQPVVMTDNSTVISETSFPEQEKCIFSTTFLTDESSF